MQDQFSGFFRGIKVFLTGHTGFKGSWLSCWLSLLGAEVTGYSLEPPTSPNLFTLCRLDERVVDIRGDVRDGKTLKAALHNAAPQLVIHFAAQPLVLESYDRAEETFATNVQGSVNLLEASIAAPSVKAVLVVTTDKVYDNCGWIYGYRENDRLGGKDPYSASKAMAEIAVASYRESFAKRRGGEIAIATARSGNVIGGGDFSKNRLLPDIAKALINGETIALRNPDSVRPWMHVLDPLSGYLTLSKRLLIEGSAFAEAWNFAPMEHAGISCRTVVKKAVELWGEGRFEEKPLPSAPVEMQLLRLCGDKAANELGWLPSYSWERAVEATISWYRSYSSYLSDESACDIYSMTVKQIEEFTARKRAHLSKS